MPKDLSISLSAVFEPPTHISSNPDIHLSASDCGKCSRQLGFKILEIEGKEFKPDFASQYNMYLGRVLHETVQAAITLDYPLAEHEKYWRLDGLSGKADSFYVDPVNGDRVLCEYKSCNQKTFDFVRSRNVPNNEHYLQAGLSGVALGATKLRIIYICKVTQSDGTFLQEFYLDIDAMAIESEKRRLQYILGANKMGMLPDRVYNNAIIDPSKETKFPCPYCDFRELCILFGKGNVKINKEKLNAHDRTFNP